MLSSVIRNFSKPVGRGGSIGLYEHCLFRDTFFWGGEGGCFYTRGSAIILLVFHSRPVWTDGPSSVGGGGGGHPNPFSLLPLTGFEPMQAQSKQEVPTP